MNRAFARTAVVPGRCDRFHSREAAPDPVVMDPFWMAAAMVVMVAAFFGGGLHLMCTGNGRQNNPPTPPSAPPRTSRPGR